MNEIMSNDNVLFGFMAFVAGIICLIKVMYERKTSLRIDGVISSFAQNSGNYFPVVTFTYEGNEYTMRAANGGSKPKGNVGDAVEVLYRPKNQKYVNLTGSNGDIMVAVVLIVLGAALLAIGLLA